MIHAGKVSPPMNLEAAIYQPTRKPSERDEKRGNRGLGGGFLHRGQGGGGDGAAGMGEDRWGGGCSCMFMDVGYGLVQQR